MTWPQTGGAQRRTPLDPEQGPVDLPQIQLQDCVIAGAEATARRIEAFLRSAVDQYNAVCFLSLGVAAAQSSPSRNTGRRTTRSPSGRWPRSRKAFDREYGNYDLILTDTDLDPLRSREDIKALLADHPLAAKPTHR